MKCNITGMTLDEYKSAKIIISDMFESEKLEYTLTEKTGSLHIDSKNFKDGVYIYLLIVDDIIVDVKANPKAWTRNSVADINDGIKKDNIVLCNHGNSVLLSVMDVKIDGIKQLVTNRDSRKLERLINWWYETIDLEHLIKR